MIVISKTFTTAETMLNARTVRSWLTAELGECRRRASRAGCLSDCVSTDCESRLMSASCLPSEKQNKLLTSVQASLYHSMWVHNTPTQTPRLISMRGELPLMQSQSLIPEFLSGV